MRQGTAFVPRAPRGLTNTRRGSLTQNPGPIWARMAEDGRGLAWQKTTCVMQTRHSPTQPNSRTCALHSTLRATLLGIVRQKAFVEQQRSQAGCGKMGVCLAVQGWHVALERFHRKIRNVQIKSTICPHFFRYIVRWIVRCSGFASRCFHGYFAVITSVPLSD